MDKKSKPHEISPLVDNVAEFFEIVNDFSDPLEIFREAISNAIDWGATFVEITCSVDQVQGRDKLIIRIADNGLGMTWKVFDKAFWGLGVSPAREIKRKGDELIIGEKGHGTKIFLRSETVKVRTQSSEGAYEGICLDPFGALSEGKLHSPTTWKINPFMSNTGTEIEVIGYNQNERSRFLQNVVKDYILWFTKAGSIERMFNIDRLKDFKVRLKCIDWKDQLHEVISFGHYFPKENSNINKLFKDKELDAADWYVKRFIWREQKLKDHPEVTYDVIISVEGDDVKRSYNPLIKDRIRPNTDVGCYRVRDRYGIWICKDYIPITQVNNWITGFGSGSNAFVLLHGFVNCQRLKLTANRGTIANTEPQILEELKTKVQQHIEEIDKHLKNEGIYTLIQWQEEQLTKQQEISDFKMRIKRIKSRKIAYLDKRLLLEPSNESELFGLFMMVYTLRPELFTFEPLDYSTVRGIDIIGGNKIQSNIVDRDHWYIEFKYLLQSKINHGFDNIRWIVCWDFDRTIIPGAQLVGIEEDDIRILTKTIDENDFRNNIYFLDSKTKPHKIQIIRLKEFLWEMLNIDFKEQP
jgi:hypothetical protein